MKIQSYPSDLSQEEWDFVAPYRTLMKEDAPQREHSLREVFNALRWLARAGYDGYKRRKGSKVHMAVDTLGHLIELTVTPANEQERSQVKALCEAVQESTGETVQVAWGDQGYTGEQARDNAKAAGIDLRVVKLPEARKGFVLLPRRWVVERSFGWLARFRRLSRDFERLPHVLAALHFLVFVTLMLPKAAPLWAAGESA